MVVGTRSGKVFGETCQDNSNERYQGDVDRSRSSRDRRMMEHDSMKAKEAKRTKVEKQDAVPLTNPQRPRELRTGAGAIGREEFEEILKERKAERKRQAEENRLEGLRKIKEKNSKTGVSPLDHFPKEIWVQILNQLGCEDLSGMWELHPHFRDLLEENRIRDILFPQVLDPQGRFAQRWLEELTQQDYYFFNPDSSTLRLNQRLVSKSMRDAIDKLLEEDLLFSMRTEYPSEMCQVKVRSHQIRKPVAFLMTKDFDTAKLNKILEIKKPMRIVGRELSILIRPSSRNSWDQNNERYLEYFNQFKDNVTQALREIGDQIWRLKFTCGFDINQPAPAFFGLLVQNFGLSSVELYKLLREWLLLLPNIKWLEIYLHEVHIGTIDELTRQANPLPTLNALERIDFLNHYNRYNETLCDALIVAYPHIKMINYNFCDPDFFQRIFHPRAVQSLNLERFIVGVWDVPKHNPFKLFKPMLNCSWNLKMVNLTSNGLGCSTDSILQMLNHFPLLENVTLDVGQVRIGNERNHLRLPNLQDFALKFKQNTKYTMGRGCGREYMTSVKFFHSLQFLLHCTKLRSLKWINAQDDSTEFQLELLNCDFEGTIDFKGGFENLSESNLWDVFPRLENVLVEFTKREGYISMAYVKKYKKRKLDWTKKERRGFYL